MIPERFKVLKPFIEGKEVLHLGCVQHDWKVSVQQAWIHSFIAKYSEKLIGIDILEDDAKKLTQIGYDIRYGNAESFNLSMKFDVVFAGELIEHLGNLEGFFDSCKRHMKSDSKLIITTPNCFGIRYSLWHLLGRRFVNPEHTCWFDRHTIKQLLNRYGFRIEIWGYILLDSPLSLKRPYAVILTMVERLFRKLAPTLFIVAGLK